MSTLEKTLKELGYTNFRVLIEDDLCNYTKTGVTTYKASSKEAELHYYNIVEWTLDDGTVTMSPSAFPVGYDIVGPIIELKMLRDERNKLLQKSDWTQSRDVKLTNDDEWILYRQSLRDITNSYSSIFDVVWPTEPS